MVYYDVSSNLIPSISDDHPQNAPGVSSSKRIEEITSFNLKT